jgi:lipopolysaccharide export system permease protein
MPSNPVIENFTYFSLGNRLYYGKKFNLKTHSMEEGFIILFFDEKKRVRRKVFAKNGQWENNAWTLRNVTDYETGAEGKMLGEPRIYSEKVYEEITETPKEMAKSSNESALLSYRELKYYIQQMQENSLQSYRERVDLHYKLSSPWNSLIMMFIAILFLTVSRRKKVIALNVLYCLGLAFLFHVIGAISLAMGKAGTLPPFLSAWSSNLLFAVGSIFFLDRAND